MPVFNSAPYIELACESILNQTFRDLELVVVDDGSTDGTTERLRALAAGDPRVRLVTRENRGLIPTRNELLALARGELIAWMDSDDISVPERIAEQVKHFDADPSLVCLGGSVLEIDPDGEPIGRVDYPASYAEVLAGIQRGGAMRFPTTMVRCAAALSVGEFRHPFTGFEDFDFLVRLSEVGTCLNLQEILLWYRQHPDNISRRLSGRWPLCRDAILALAEERRQGAPDRLQRGEVLTLPFPTVSAHPTAGPWDSHRSWVYQALSAGNVRTARKHAIKALKMEPKRLASWKLGVRALLAIPVRPRDPGTQKSSAG